MSFVRTLALALLASAPAAALAAGGHDAVGCGGCHAIHTAKGEIIFAVAPNKASLNPKTKQPYTGTTALCLGCHEESSKGGQGYAPISGHMSHPYGLASVNPKVAKVPAELLRDGRFECIGCHDPHPSNPYYKYLRVDTAKGSKMDAFCAVCHPVKADSSLANEKPAFFTSMDETGNRVLAAPAAKSSAAAEAAPAKKPAAKKK
jgi:predicted CXXCH cytochrome family protein